jgi:hypothetical protein
MRPAKASALSGGARDRLAGLFLGLTTFQAVSLLISWAASRFGGGAAGPLNPFRLLAVWGTGLLVFGASGLVVCLRDWAADRPQGLE